jgi:methyl-accepting chemotaxis protein
MKRFHPGIRLKLLAIVVLSAVSLLAVGGIALRASYQQLVDDRVTMIRAINDAAKAQAAGLAKQVEAGKLSKEQAVEAFREILHVARFGAEGKDYTFAYTMDGTAISNAGNPALEGKNLMGLTGPDGRKVIVELVEGARTKGKGVIIYLWPRPGQTEPVRKMAYYDRFDPLDMFVATAVYIDDVDTAFHELAVRMVVVTGLLLLVSVCLTMFVSLSITRPLAALGLRMRRLADGNLDEDILEAARKDEIGKMAATVHVFKHNALEMRRMEREQEAVKQRAEAERRDALLAMAQNFEAQVKHVADQLESSAQDMEASARQMTEKSAKAGEQVADASQAARESTESVQTVASAAEELLASISEIGKQASQSAGLTEQAVDEAGDAFQVIEGLAGAAAKIGEVVKLINDVAAQTNLLALNATIEAARAGEAGKGFAVVANEVKALANQTARATDEISAQIGVVQNTSTKAVDVIGKVRQTINQVNGVAAAIAAAVEEQNAATAEISRSAQTAATGVDRMAKGIASAGESAEATGRDAKQVLEASSATARQSHEIQQAVQEFLVSVRRAQS